MQPVSGLLHHRDHESERQYGPYGQIPPWNTGRSSFQRFQETPHEMSNRQVAIQNKAKIFLKNVSIFMQARQYGPFGQIKPWGKMNLNEVIIEVMSSNDVH